MSDQPDLQTELAKIDALLQGLEAALSGEELEAARKPLLARRAVLVGLQAGGDAVTSVKRAVTAGNITASGGNVNLAVGDIYQHFNAPPPGADPKTLREAYLNWVLEQVSRLSLAGIDPKAASEAEAYLSLGAVYTALLTQSVEPLEGQDKSERQMSPEREKPRLSALAQLDRHARLVLLGDPGSGKSTFVNFVALCLAGVALGRDDANLDLLRSPLPPDSNERDEKKQPEPQPWRHEALLPVRVVLRDFAARGLPEPGQPANAKHLLDFIKAELDAVALGEYADHLIKELRQQGGLLLLDGLDEAPEAQSRRAQIKQVAEAFAGAFPKLRILVTSRTYAYQKQDWRLNGFQETVLAPFSPGQIDQFVERWYAHIAILRKLNPQDAQGRAELLKRAIRASDRLQGLAERPLLLTLMASLHAWRGGSLPERREELYADTVDLLLDWWESPKVVRDGRGQVIVSQPGLVEYLRLDDRQKLRQLLDELAYDAHGAQPDLQGTADVAEAALIAGLTRISNNPDLRPARLVEYLSQRAGLLVPRGVGVYTFPHRTFQEYLAACHLTDHDFPEKIAELACQDFNRWREVALLAGAKAARGTSSAVWALVDALCYADVTPGAAPGTLWGAHLAGQAMVESGNLGMVSERNFPKLERVRRGLVQVLGSDLPAVERAAAGRSLAKLGDPRPEAIACEQMQFCFVPAGPFWMGSKEEQDPQADDDESPLHEVDLPAFWMGRYPVTQAQFAEFVVAGGYREERYWEEAKTHGYWSTEGFKGIWDDSARLKPDRYGEPFDLLNHPAVGVSWYEALAFARWLGEQLGRAVRLPSEAEWEKAARGGIDLPPAPLVRSLDAGFDLPKIALQLNLQPQRIYPWGNKHDPNQANYDETGIGATSAMGCFPGGASPYGVLDMSGNVWEWTRSLNKDYPYRPQDGREELGQTGARVLRGGSFLNVSRHVRCAFRCRDIPDHFLRSGGFRVCLPHLPQA
ncbi:MAG: SUMF1/EgtB/PvdO family nonheme iron enzyme [Anaerolineales bacterium]|nr:SUMF1/EgtB/PvdO family nonheme iron enzyme [Anaerolineales bacterium]